MSEDQKLALRVYHGPNLFAPHAAVVTEFPISYPIPLPQVQLAQYLGDVFSPEFREIVDLPSGVVSFMTAVERLAAAFHDLAGPCELPVEVEETDGGHSRLVIGFHVPETAEQACRLALRVAQEAFAPEPFTGLNKRAAATILSQARRMMWALQPDFIARSLMRIARTRNIPVYCVSPGSSIWQYGQGHSSWSCIESASHLNSLTGRLLAQNKVLSNQLVMRLGLPGVKQKVARAPESLSAIAGELGYPLIVKPVDRGKGLGVTTDIQNHDQLRGAFEQARPHSNFGVIVEQQIPGDDHRLAVFGGNFKWGARRSPPKVTGDGVHTLGELIDIENTKRTNADIATGFVSRIVIDAELRAFIAKQGLSLTDRPEAGLTIRLRGIANMATGATLADCTAQVHPDNREMAESIARCFHMECIGIDFMTSDISQSWRELACGVIEVNAVPGFSSDGRAEIIMEERFPPGNDGRIASFVLIGTEAELLEKVSDAVRPHVDGSLGQTTSEATYFAGHRRCDDTDTLPARVLALLLEPSCRALVIFASVEDIEKHGFPLDRCDLALIGGSCSAPTELGRLVASCADKVIAPVSSENFAAVALPSINATVDARMCRAAP